MTICLIITTDKIPWYRKNGIPKNITHLDWKICEPLPDLSENTNLISLFCAKNKLTSLPPLPSSLLHLNCNDNEIISLTLPPNLELLNCSNNRLTSLPNLPESLRILICDSNKLISLPPLPPYLNKLLCQNNKLTLLPPLPRKINTLDCSFNNLFYFPDIRGLTTVSIICTDNKNIYFSDFPESEENFDKIPFIKRVQKRWRKKFRKTKEKELKIIFESKLKGFSSYFVKEIVKY